MMNLGDGLLFELENGKPRLVLAKYAHTGAESKTSNKKGSGRIAPRKKTQKLISKQGPPQADRAEPGRKSKHAVASVGQSVSHRGKARQSSDGVDRVRASGDVPAMQQKESVVCLTQEQFQQILSSISSRPAEQHSAHTHAEPEASYGAETAGESEECVLDNGASEEKTEKEPLSDGPQSGLFHTFGERERERDKLEARKAQWRRELDEQMALKRQQKSRLEELKAHSRTSERSKDVTDSAGLSTQTSAGPESFPHRSREIPAAVRSALVVGEAAPLEDRSGAQREQQRRWLQELDKQRDEDQRRRQQDREINSKADDIDLWTVHFDSLHPSPSVSSVAVPDSSSVRDIPSVCGADALGRASVDTTQGKPQRASYLRTMTALLDPAQIEERERRRIKQIEHQRAIEAQVEERRRQREREESRRREEEQEEERRLERERERLLQQSLRDTQQHTHTEEVHSRKTEELYLSIQRAQEEASRIKHLQRIRDLAKRGHDVSKLLHSLDGDTVSQALRDLPGISRLSSSSESQTQRTAAAASPRKDTAVQTELGDQPESEAVKSADKQCPNEETRSAPPNSGNAKKPNHGEVKASEKTQNRENVCPAFKEDPYEPYARSSRSRRPEKRPEWSTQRKGKTFVPNSERYPENLRRHRQESRKQRQIQLRTLVERNTRTHASGAHGTPPLTQTADPPEEPPALSAQRKSSSALKSRVHRPSRQTLEETQHPPLLDFVPFVRTDEVYHMDPLAPLSRPSTHEARHRAHSAVRSSSQASALVPQEPDPPKNTERQQAILKGLSQLRQGLLQRQKELETSLNPAPQTQHRNHFSPFRPL